MELPIANPSKNQWISSSLIEFPGFKALSSRINQHDPLLSTDPTTSYFHHGHVILVAVPPSRTRSAYGQRPQSRWENQVHPRHDLLTTPWLPHTTLERMAIASALEAVHQCGYQVCEPQIIPSSSFLSPSAAYRHCLARNKKSHVGNRPKSIAIRELPWPSVAHSKPKSANAPVPCHS